GPASRDDGADHQRLPTPAPSPPCIFPTLAAPLQLARKASMGELSAARASRGDETVSMHHDRTMTDSFYARAHADRRASAKRSAGSIGSRYSMICSAVWRNNSTILQTSTCLCAGKAYKERGRRESGRISAPALSLRACLRR